MILRSGPCLCMIAYEEEGANKKTFHEAEIHNRRPVWTSDSSVFGRGSTKENGESSPF